MSNVKKSREAQASGRRWKQWKEPEARAVLDAWRRSGLSVSAFCAREGYSDTRLRYWAERVGESTRSQSASVSFVPVRFGEARRAHQIEIERAGVVVPVREDLDPEFVARLVVALAAKEPAC